MTRTSDFTQGKIFGPLIRFSLPILLSLVLQTAYGAVDLWMVGKFAQAVDISAVSTGSQLMHSITSVVAGLTMGATVLLVRIPVSFLMSRIVPVSLFRIGLATPCSSVVQIALCGVFFLVLRHK